MQKFVPREVRGWKVQDTVETYDRETIFDYIDGAGEIYRSYSFKEVIVFRYSRVGASDIVVEVFDMGSGEDAYGIFSHARESEESGVGQGYEYRGGVLNFWKGRYYICVLAEKSFSETKEAIFALAQKIDEKIQVPGSKPKLVEYLPEEKLIPQSIRFFHLQASLNYHYFLAEQNILNLNRHTRAVLASYESGSTYLLCVQYQTPQEAKEAYRRFVESYLPGAQHTGIAQIEQGQWVASKLEQEYVIIALDAPSEKYASHLVNVFRNRLLQATP